MIRRSCLSNSSVLTASIPLIQQDIRHLLRSGAHIVVSRLQKPGRAHVGLGGARAPGVETRDLHLAPRWHRPPAREHAQPHARRAQARAAVQIRYAFALQVFGCLPACY